MKGFEKHFRIKSIEIKTCGFGDNVYHYQMQIIMSCERYIENSG